MSVNNEHEMLEPEQELKNVGLKATAPRMRILELFQKAQEAGAVRHLTAEDIYKQLVAENIEVGLATVYRVLTQFEAAGLIVRHYFGNDRASYEMDDGAHHDHIVCTRCGRVEEFVASNRSPYVLVLNSKGTRCPCTAFVKIAVKKKRRVVNRTLLSEFKNK